MSKNLDNVVIFFCLFLFKIFCFLRRPIISLDLHLAGTEYATMTSRRKYETCFCDTFHLDTSDKPPHASIKTFWVFSLTVAVSISGF